MGRKRKRKNSRKAKSVGCKRLEIAALELELCAAYDGPLRGFVEPAILLAAFRLYDGMAALVGRKLLRPALKARPLPAQFPVTGELRYSSTFAEQDMIALLAIALEEDSGADVTRVFALLEHTQELTLWSPDEQEPHPRWLWEYKDLAAELPHATPIELMLNAEPLRPTVRADDYISACVCLIRCIRQQEHRRLRFVDSQSLNDWALTLDVRVT